jgi:hypothetical protein
MEAIHRRVAEIALSEAGSQGLALAGGYAVRAHGIGDRLSGDVDLFTDWQHRAEFPVVVQAVVSALNRHGFAVTADARGDTFARLLVKTPEDPDGEEYKVELAADPRLHAPVVLGIGPVLHPDDAVANKMGALYGRALPRDFLDIDAAITSGRYTRERLVELAAASDGGFDTAIFAMTLGALNQITDEAFFAYDASIDAIREMRSRFADGQAELLRPTDL